MAKKTSLPLHPGPGAIANVLTRMMKPTVPVATNDKNHRSRIVIVDRIQEKGKYRYTFHLEGGDNNKLFNASCQFVTILKEGDSRVFFNEIESTRTSKSKYNINSNSNDDFKEPKIGWKKSKARKLLYDDIMEGRVPSEAMSNGRRTTDYTEVYLMHQEYAAWDFGKLPSRLAGIRKTIKEKKGRAADDRALFDNFVENNPVSTFSHYGYIQWQGSEAQKYVKQDLKNRTIDRYRNRKIEYWLTKPEFYNKFPLQVF